MAPRSYILASMLAATALVSTNAEAAPVLWSLASGGNGHYYEALYDYGSFDSDRAVALSSTFMGMKGYLATITSAAENAFIYNNVSSAEAFIGGSDEEQEGTWKWVDGPEAGGVFYSTSGAPLDYTYNNWNSGEPNNGSVRPPENALITNTGGPGGWNDGKNAERLGIGYIVEYGTSVPSGAVPEPATWALMVLGFGAVGAAMRKRRQVRVTYA